MGHWSPSASGLLLRRKETWRGAGPSLRLGLSFPFRTSYESQVREGEGSEFKGNVSRSQLLTTAEGALNSQAVQGQPFDSPMLCSWASPSRRVVIGL